MERRIYNKTKFVLLLLVILMPILSACEFKDIDKNVFVTAIGIDTSDNTEKPYKITLKLYVPSSSLRQQPKPEYAYISSEGASLSEAIRMLETHVDKKLEFGHSKVILIGEDMLNRDVKDLMDYLIRRADIQMISWVAAARPTASEILELVPTTESAAYPALYNYFDTIGNESPYVVNNFLFEFRRKVLESGIDPILPLIEKDDKESQYIINRSLVVPEKGGRPVEFSPLETKLYNVLIQEAPELDLIVKRKDLNILAMIDQYKAKYKVNLSENGRAKIYVDVNMTGIISESKFDLNNQNLKDYSKQAEAEVKAKLTDFIKKIQDEGVDPIGFGIKYKTTRLHNHINIDQWTQAYKNAQVELKVKVELKSTGVIQ